MSWPGSSTFDTTYHFQKTANFSAFLRAINNLHKILDDDGSGVAPTVDLTSPLPANSDYFAACSGGAFVQPVIPSVGILPPGRNMYAIDMVHSWIDRNMYRFIATAKKSGGSWSSVSNYNGQLKFTRWGSANTTEPINDVANLYEYIGVVGRDSAGQQSSFTRKRPAWINDPAATFFDDDAGNGNNLPVINDVAYYTIDGQRYKYISSGVWTALAPYDSSQVRVLVGCGLPKVGDYYTYPEFWQELYKAVQALRWTYSIHFTGGGFVMGADASATVAFGRLGDASSVISAEAAKAEAMNSYTITEVGAGSVNWGVRAWVHSHLGTSPSYDAHIERGRAAFDIQGGGVVASSAPILARTIDYYYIGTNVGLPLDNLGTGIDISGNLTLWESEGPDTNPKTESIHTLVYPDVNPTWPTIVTVDTAFEYDVDGGVSIGISLTRIQPYVVFRWDGAGGLAHLGGGAAEFAMWFTDVAQFM